ncbi:thymidylate synthase [Spizellomyces punctatus DAOM BR117]|uniref:thymidylate synthase n=1 Tax=Spizellomyces punctatus (strain DAOM BR117) TaxID=645134 RepID=A0A0L0HMV8_SPIPD|nr:thymidylate synthase [Spizellomyces punctatus DAOM BR117]KND02432.1 thymidylate synthase [Spizellomyces punctatus DAOM BR117]|eukprot:XP_016610471.1 thymidylate synthase [Spizellomyces punctatus DAOM BR117]
MLAGSPDNSDTKGDMSSSTTSAFSSPYLPGPGVHPEHQYLSLIRTILQQGYPRADRTGTGTLSLFAPPQLRFSLAENSFPLLTTKRVPLRIVFEELMFFIRGQTDSTILSKKGVKIWDGNGSREALDRIGLVDRRVGDLGPVYGFQWRHFGAEYVNADEDYKGKGVDQLREVIRLIKENPADRRIIMSAWNPADLSKMALPPCHMFCQFYVSTPTPTQPATLSCQLYQRSCDMGLGVPFNIASYALLTILIAHVTNLVPGEFIHCLGDAHVYKDHIDALKVQLEREPRPFPRIYIKGGESKATTVNEMVKELEEFEWERLELVGYEPYGKIEMKMSV